MADQSLNPIVVLQDDIYRYLYAEPYFIDLGVFKLRDATIQTRIDQVVRGLDPQAGKIGAAVSVLMAQMRVVHPNEPGPQPNAQITVRCQENPDFNFGMANGARKSAEEMALQVMRVLNHKRAEGFYEALRFEQDAGVPNYDFAPWVTYDVTALTSVPVDEWDQVQLPAIESNGLEVTMTCATAGASIYWTSDDTHPTPANGTRAANGTLYAGALDINGLELLNKPVRAAAYVGTGARGSDVARLMIL